MAEWIRSLAVSLHCTTSQTGQGSNPGAGRSIKPFIPPGSIDWYQPRLGFEVLSADDGWLAWLPVGGSDEANG